jgi:tetratricopeptide (TPR) repeat protein
MPGIYMKQKLFTAIFLLLIFHLHSCVSIYRYERDKRDRNYKEGVELYKQKMFVEAHDCFETVIDIEPDYKDAKSYLKKTERLLALKARKIKRNANINYEKGVSMMNSGRYDDALGFLLLAQEQDPDHVDIDEKIDECRGKLAPMFEKLLKQAELQFQRKQYIPANQTCLKAKTYNPSNSRISSMSREIESKLEKKAANFVDKGKLYYNKKQFPAAKTQLQLALKANPWDKNSKELLDNINGRLNLDKNYNKGIKLYNNADYFGAKAVFNQVHAAEPGYKATSEYMTKINTALAGKIDIYYNNGVSFYEKGNYKAAIAEFNKVLLINPSHSNAQEYIQRARPNMEMKKSIGGEGKPE